MWSTLYYCQILMRPANSRQIFEKDSNIVYNEKCILVFMWSTLYYCQSLVRLAISRQIFEKYSNIVYNEKCILIFMWSTLYYCQILMRLAIFRQIFEKYSNIVYNEKCILVFMWSTLYYCQILMRLAISRQIFEKYSNIVYNENPFSGSRVLSFGRTEGQAEKRTDKTKPVVSFHSFANAPSNGDEGQHVSLRIDISVAFNADYWSKDNANKDYLHRFNKEYVTDDDLNIINP